MEGGWGALDGRVEADDEGLTMKTFLTTLEGLGEACAAAAAADVLSGAFELVWDVAGGEDVEVAGAADVDVDVDPALVAGELAPLLLADVGVCVTTVVAVATGEFARCPVVVVCVPFCRLASALRPMSPASAARCLFDGAVHRRRTCISRSKMTFSRPSRFPLDEVQGLSSCSEAEISLCIAEKEKPICFLSGCFSPHCGFLPASARFCREIDALLANGRTDAGTTGFVLREVDEPEASNPPADLFEIGNR